jgi:integrase
MANGMAKFNFTKASIDRLPIPDKGWAYHYDLKVQGLGIGIGKTGKKTFVLYRKISGKPERLTLGPYPDLTIEKARGKASEINSAIASGANPADAKRGRAAELTFAELFSQYIQRHAKLHKRTWAEDIQRFEQYLAASLGKKKLSMVNRQLVAAVHTNITMAGRPVVANRVLALVSSIFGWAVSAGLMENNPVRGIKHNREKSRDRFLQSDELPRFFNALAEEENETMRDYFLLSLLTGARRANMLSMQWADVNMERAEWHLKTTKNDAPQTVTLSPEAIEILNSRMNRSSSPFVFPGSGKTGHLAEPKKGWQRVLVRAKLDDVRIHDLRRTLGSWQAKQGASLAIIGKSLNHKNLNTTAIYARLDSDPVRNSVNTATSAMMEAAGLTKAASVLLLRRKG